MAVGALHAPYFLSLQLPTLLGMLDLPVPKAVEGMDLSHCALGTEGPKPEAALIPNTGACAAWQDGHEWRALRDKRFSYGVYRHDDVLTPGCIHPGLIVFTRG